MIYTSELTVLDNGVRIIFDNDPGRRTCSMGIWAASGSAFETAETSGAAHFIEHMLFRGTQRRSSFDIAEQMDEIGGVINAYTAKEYTCFYAHALTEHTERAFDILGDMLTDPRLDPKDIKLEKGVICEEIAMYEDSPEDLCADKYYESVWRSSMMGANILGTTKTVNAVDKERLVKHMTEFYAPERLVISFCGGFDKKTMLEQCKKYFGGQKSTGNPLVAPKANYSASVVTVPKDFEQNQIIIGFPGILYGDDSRFAVNLMSGILGGASSSRLFQRIRDELGLVYSIDASSVPYLGAGVFVVSLGLSAKSEERAITETIKILRSFGKTVTEKELARVKEQTVAGLVMNSESVSSRASSNAQSVLLRGRLRNEDELVRRIRSVSLDEVREAAENILDFNNVSLCAAGKVKGTDYYTKLIKS